MPISPGVLPSSLSSGVDFGNGNEGIVHLRFIPGMRMGSSLRRVITYLTTPRV